mmetsp:Transcript_32593/g.66445  ORF Transcript_32593/g.66445 Transcript_32593/m.66445 type:complete len:104 (-) Transcript_32593:46-357(-)
MPRQAPTINTKINDWIKLLTLIVKLRPIGSLFCGCEVAMPRKDDIHDDDDVEGRHSAVDGGGGFANMMLKRIFYTADNTKSSASSTTTSCPAFTVTLLLQTNE